MTRYTTYEKIFPLLAACGFDCVDYSLTGHNEQRDSFFQRLCKHKAIAEACGLQFGQAHGPYPYFVKEGLFPDCQFYNESQIMAIEGAKYLSIPYLVMHPCVIDGGTEKGRKDLLTANMNLFSSLIPVLKNSGVTVCIENCYCEGTDTYGDPCTIPTCGSSPEELIYLIDSLNDRAGREIFGSCLDTGHCHCSGGDEIEMVRKLGKRIKALHLHDNDGRTDYHLPPFSIPHGVPWEKLMRELSAVGYEGSLNLELETEAVMGRTPELTKTVLCLAHEIGIQLEKMFGGN